MIRRLEFSGFSSSSRVGRGTGNGVNNWWYLCEEATIKSQLGSESFWVTWKWGESGWPRKGMETLHPFLYILPCASLPSNVHLYPLSYPNNKLVGVSEHLPESRSHCSKSTKPKRGSLEPLTICACHWHLQAGGSPWDWWNLWGLTLPPGRYCWNWVESLDTGWCLRMACWCGETRLHGWWPEVSEGKCLGWVMKETQERNTQ